MSKDRDFVLTSAEMSRVNARLAERTGGRVQIGPGPVLNSQAKAIWEASRAFIINKAEPVLARRRRAPSMGLALGSAAMSLSGCAMLNPNVKGSFDCRAPDGTCSPTTSIDNRALSDIARGGAGEVAPIGTYEVPEQEPRLQMASFETEAPKSKKRSKSEREARKVREAIADTSTAAPVPAANDPARTNERVLRIVFPAHVDRHGRFVEASAVHAVVERGAWLRADAANAPIRSSERPSLTEFASSAPELTFADLDGSRSGAAEEVETASVAGPAASAAPARSTPPGAPQLAPRAPGGGSVKAAPKMTAVPAEVRGKLQALKPIVVTPRPGVVAFSQNPGAAGPTKTSLVTAGSAAMVSPAPINSPNRASAPKAADLSPAAAPVAAAGDPSSSKTSARAPLMQTAPASANALVQAGVSARLDEMRAAAVSAAKGAVAPDQPANPPAHFSASGIDQ